MKNLLFVFAVTAFGLAISQPGAGATKNQDTTAGNGTFSVELTKTLDSKKLKDGDPVEVKLTGSVTLPDGTNAVRGAKVIGHVTQAKARSKKDSESTLGISFDKVAVSGGQEALISGVVLAATPGPDVETGSRGLADGYSSLGEMAETNTAVSAGQSTPTLSDRSRGVLGIRNLKLTDGVFTSTGKEVRLDSGTRMLLSVSTAK